MTAIDLSTAATPKSDQLNADDLIGGGKTIRIRDVKLATTGEQRCSIFYDGDNGKPWKPCKSMIRVLMHVWGPDGSQYIGRSVELYRDEKVLWAGDAVGGIRVRAVTNIDRPVTMSLTKTKGSKAPFTVQPLTPPKAEDLEAKKKAAEEKRKAAATKACGGIIRDIVGAEQDHEAFAAVMTRHADTIARFREGYPDLAELVDAAITARNEANKE